MGVPRMQSCCFVFDLKTGNIVLGCVNAVYSFAMTVVMVVLAGELGAAGGEDEDVAVPGVLVPDADERAALVASRVLCIVLAVLFLAKLVFDLLFVYGVVYERAAIVKAYFVMWVVFFLLSAFTFSVNLPHFSATTIVAELFYNGMNVYAVRLSYSYYKQLNEREVL